MPGRPGIARIFVVAAAAAAAAVYK